MAYYFRLLLVFLSIFLLFSYGCTGNSSSENQNDNETQNNNDDNEDEEGDDEYVIIYDDEDNDDDDDDSDDQTAWINEGSLTPSKNATNVSPKTNIIITFEREMKESTINEENIFLENQDSEELVDGSLSYDSVSKTATFNPSVADLDVLTTYLVHVSGEVMDEDGNKMGEEFIFSFETGAGELIRILSYYDENGFRYQSYGEEDYARTTSLIWTNETENFITEHHVYSVSAVSELYSYTVDEDSSSWLSVLPCDEDYPDYLCLSIDASKLNEGDYVATITFIDEAATPPIIERTLTVRVDRTPPEIISVEYIADDDSGYHELVDEMESVPVTLYQFRVTYSENVYYCDPSSTSYGISSVKIHYATFDDGVGSTSYNPETYIEGFNYGTQGFNNLISRSNYTLTIPYPETNIHDAAGNSLNPIVLDFLSSIGI